MAKRGSLHFVITLAGVVSLGLLAGCSNGTTYGTGVSQQAQLATDVGGLLLLGSGDKKKPIDYSSRAKLVKAPQGNELPAPAETIESDSAYFPTNPEEARARKLATLNTSRNGPERTSVPSESDINGLADDGNRPGIAKKRSLFENSDHSPRADEDRAATMNGREARLARIKEIRTGGTGVARRKYLTQPPVEYRKPAETAEEGKLGERVYLPTDKRKKGLFAGWGRD